MRVIVAGSRSVMDYDVVAAAVEASGFQVTQVVSGCAAGVDRLGEIWAKEHKIPVRRFPADWGRLGKVAGMVRNLEIAKHADALVAVWDGKSRGTENMIRVARRRGLKVYVVQVGREGLAGIGDPACQRG